MDPDPHQFADDKPKCMEQEPIFALFHRFEPLFARYDLDLHPDPHQMKIRIRIRIRATSRFRIQIWICITLVIRSMLLNVKCRLPEKSSRMRCSMVCATRGGYSWSDVDSNTRTQPSYLVTVPVRYPTTRHRTRRVPVRYIGVRSGRYLPVLQNF